MEKARYLVQAHLVEGRPVAELASAHGIHRATLYKLISRYRQGGEEALAPRSRRPKSSPGRTPSEVEDDIVWLRKQLEEEGLDAGAETIHYHLNGRHGSAPSVSTIWRILRARGFVSPQPKKRPRSSFVRFEAELPNECWQSDMTHWQIAGEVGVEIISFIDDCSRLALGCFAYPVVRARDVVDSFHKAAKSWGYPASVLTDNGCIYTAKYRGGKAAMESVLEDRGIVFKHGRPYHPQTQGKIERFQQTLKQHLGRQPLARSIEELQVQLDSFITYYNEVRPHRSADRQPPKVRFDARIKAKPGELSSTQFRIRRDRVDKTGNITIRYRSRLHHIGMGRQLKNRRVVMFVAGRDIRVVDEETGELLRHLELDPAKDYQPQNRRPN